MFRLLDSSGAQFAVRVAVGQGVAESAALHEGNERLTQKALSQMEGKRSRGSMKIFLYLFSYLIVSPISIEVRPNRPKPNEGESHGEHHFQGQKSFLPKEVSELFFSLFILSYFFGAYSVKLNFSGDYVRLRQNPLWSELLSAKATRRLLKRDKLVVFADVANLLQVLSKKKAKVR